MRKNPEENARQVDCPVAISIEPAIRHDAVDATKRVALVAIHGMGQQLPFETIDDALEGIYGPQTRASVTGVRAAFVSTDTDTTATVRDTLEPRVRLDIVRNDADGASSSVGVDVYEVHWSDFTSKATSALETYWFLVVSACSGVAFKLTPGRLVKPYVRWVDGVELRPDIPTWHILMLCLAMLDVLALGAIGVLFFAVAAYRAVAIVLALNEIESLLQPMQSIVNLFFVIAGLSGVLLMLAAFIEKQRPHRAGENHAAAPVTAERASRPFVRILAVTSGWAFFLGPLLTALIVAGFVLGRGRVPGPFLTGMPTLEVLVWIAGLAVYLVVQHFLTEFVGDVVIYMSAHRVSRFHGIRDRIRQQAERTVEAVLAMNYRHIVIAAHSLGSVVAYDTLNALFLSQLATTGTCDAQRVHLVTYGSPLRKRAFLMRKFGSESRIRSALLGAAQPIVAFADQECPHCKLASWTNVWSRQDWISGELTPDTFGFSPAGQPGPYQNVREVDLAVPLLSHLNYMSGRAVPAAICRALLS